MRSVERLPLLAAACLLVATPRDAAAGPPSEYRCAPGKPDAARQACHCPPGTRAWRDAANQARCRAEPRLRAEQKLRDAQVLSPAEELPPLLVFPPDGAGRIPFRESRLVVRAPRWAHEVAIDLCLDAACRRPVWDAPVVVKVMNGHAAVTLRNLPPRENLFWRAHGLRNGRRQGRPSPVHHFATTGPTAIAIQSGGHSPPPAVTARTRRVQRYGPRSDKTAPLAKDFPDSIHPAIHGELLEAARGQAPFDDKVILGVAVVKDWGPPWERPDGGSARSLRATIAAYDPQNLKCWVWSTAWYSMSIPDTRIAFDRVVGRDLAEIECKRFGY